MTSRLRRLLLAGSAAVALPLPRARAQGAAWPAHPVRLVVPFPAGGATDLIGRVVAQKLGGALGQPVLVDNRPGAGGTIGADLVAKAAPDGYTLLMSTSSTHSIAPALNPRLPFDAFRDFVPIAHVADAASVLVVGSAFPKDGARELVALLKANPGRFNYGSSGIGTYPHLMAELFKWRAGGLFVVHVPYRGTGLVLSDLIAGQILFLMDSIVSAQPHIRDGKVRALAVSGLARSRVLPDVPTFAELGIAGMEATNWFGVLGPAALPAGIAQRVHREIDALVRTPEVIDRFDKVGAEPAGGTPERFGRIIHDEYSSWKAVIRRAGIKPE